MKLLATLNPEDSREDEYRGYPLREAVRAVVVDDQNKIAILHVSRDGYYKLPGGGVDDGEDHMTALKRECLEEIGCNVEVTGEIGKVIEHRKFCTLNQISYYYIAKLVGEKGVPEFMEDEIEEGFREMWVGYERARNLMEENRGVGIEATEYIVPRDRMVLGLARKYLLL